MLKMEVLVGTQKGALKGWLTQHKFINKLFFIQVKLNHSHHNFQHIYAWFLYGLLTISWLVSKDIIQLIKYNRKGLLKTQGISYPKAIVSLIFWKSIYVFFILVLPTLVTGNLGLNIAGFFIMEFIAGFFLTTVFLCAQPVVCLWSQRRLWRSTVSRAVPYCGRRQTRYRL